MRDLSANLSAAIEKIDAANRVDPNESAGEPRAQRQGRLAFDWVLRLDPEASEAVLIAARAHHLERWILERSSYPDGRAGYLRWRRDNKAHQATRAAELAREAGYDDATTARIAAILLRRQLGSDSETQLLEDVACLVFLETQFDPMVERLEHDHLVGVVTKTLKKMSPAAVSLGASIDLSPQAATVLSDAVSQLSDEGDAGGTDDSSTADAGTDLDSDADTDTDSDSDTDTAGPDKTGSS